MPTMDYVNRLFARHFQSGIRGHLHELTEVSAAGSKLEKYSDYIASLERPTSLNLVKVPQFDNQILFVLNTDLILNYVDFYFGGDGMVKQRGELTRDFTDTELLCK